MRLANLARTPTRKAQTEEKKTRKKATRKKTKNEATFVRSGRVVVVVVVGGGEEEGGACGSGRRWLLKRSPAASTPGAHRKDVPHSTGGGRRVDSLLSAQRSRGNTNAQPRKRPSRVCPLPHAHAEKSSPHIGTSTARACVRELVSERASQRGTEWVNEGVSERVSE